MSKFPSAIAIDEEVARLTLIRDNLKVVESIFGDDHYSAVQAQIDVLNEGLDNDEIRERYGDEDSDDFADNVFDAAQDAQAWMHGDTDGPPSAGWAGLHNHQESTP